MSVPCKKRIECASSAGCVSRQCGLAGGFPYIEHRDNRCASELFTEGRKDLQRLAAKVACPSHASLVLVRPVVVADGVRCQPCRVAACAIFHCCPKHVLVCRVLQGRGPADVVRNVFKGACVGEQDCQTCAVLWAEMLRPNKPDFGAVGAFPVLCYCAKMLLGCTRKVRCAGGRLPAEDTVPHGLVCFAEDRSTAFCNAVLHRGGEATLGPIDVSMSRLLAGCAWQQGYAEFEGPRAC